MSLRVDELIAALRLQAHPEGGFYRQIFKSAASVAPDDGRGTRSALTAIYFLLPQGHHSRWHRVRSDEIWTHLEGEPLELIVFDGDSVREQRLGAFEKGAEPVCIVPRGMWQAAKAADGDALVACFVAPGFEFDDFTLMSDDDDAKRTLSGVGSHWLSLV